MVDVLDPRLENGRNNTRGSLAANAEVEIVPEPIGGAHTDPAPAASRIGLVHGRRPMSVRQPLRELQAPRGRSFRRRSHLDGDPNSQLLLQVRHGLPETALNSQRTLVGVGNDFVHVQFERIGSRLLDALGKAQPRFSRRTVQRSNDRNLHRLLHAPQMLEILVWAQRIRVRLRIVTRRSSQTGARGDRDDEFGRMPPARSALRTGSAARWLHSLHPQVDGQCPDDQRVETLRP